LNSIPKILHQTNFAFTDSVAKSKKSFVDKHPNWKYKFWSDQDCHELVKNFYPSFYSYWSNLEPSIKKWDAIRSIFLHKFGGLYADIDVIFYKNIDPIIPDNADLIFRSPIQIHKKFDIIKNHFMLSQPNLPFWLKHLNYIKNFDHKKFQQNPDNRTEFELDVTSHTGEIGLGKCLMREISSKLILKENIVILDPNDIINHNFTNSTKPKSFNYANVYAEHFANNSWIT
jgi:mannosyltransferase OCH1-like enzyme